MMRSIIPAPLYGQFDNFNDTDDSTYSRQPFIALHASLKINK